MPVEFDNKPVRAAEKVGEEWPDLHLAAELHTQLRA
jgi:hypothetical protein